jgi:phytoene desaturase
LRTNRPTVAVIGSGFSGLSAAAILASNGFDVHVLEKNSQLGGRARALSEHGFTFDMGPSWYWMPDVFEKYFNRFGYTASDFYELKKLDPGFAVIFGKDDVMDVPADFDSLCALFEQTEAGSAEKLRKFMDEAEYKYNAGMNDLVYKPGLSITEFMRYDLAKDVFRLQIFSSFSKHVRSRFKNPKLISLLEFPVLFLGAAPKDTPALYSLMNYSGLKIGTFYPMGGFAKVADAFRRIAEEQGAKIHTNATVESFGWNGNSISGVNAGGSTLPVNAVIGSADYHHIEQELLPESFRTYSKKYWDSRVFAPSCLIFYLGINKRIAKLRHHNLFFDEDIEQHTQDIYTDKQWPGKPLFYVCVPSKTDSSVAPEGCENIFILMPIAVGLTDAPEIRDHYYSLIMKRIEAFAGEKISENAIFKKSYSVSNFVHDYNAYKGNAYGLANTLRQTAILKPKIRSRKVSNLFYAGQLTVPGPGVPPAIISGQVAAAEVLKSM